MLNSHQILDNLRRVQINSFALKISQTCLSSLDCLPHDCIPIILPTHIAELIKHNLLEPSRFIGIHKLQKVVTVELRDFLYGPLMLQLVDL